MSPAEQPLSPQEEQLFEAFCGDVFTRDEPIEPVGAETIHAYLSGAANADQIGAIDDALHKSKTFCDELLEIADYLDELPFTLGTANPGMARKERREPLVPRLIALFRRPRFAVVGLVTLLALTVAVARVVDLWRPVPLPEAKHLAILQIESADADPMARAFCDGLVRTTTRKLSALENFHKSYWVVPADAVARKGVVVPKDASRVFGASVAVTGRLERSMDEYKLTLDLVDVSPNEPRRLRSVEIAGPIVRLSALQETIAHEVRKMLDLGLVPEASAALRAGDTEVPAAYLSYVQGHGYLQRYEKTVNLNSAIDAFERAAKSDSMYALAHTGLAEAYWRKFRAEEDVDWIRRANDEGVHALELDSSLAVTHVVFGNVLNEMGTYEQAISAFQKAQAIDSTVAGAHNGLADAYAQLGRLEAAEATYVTAIRSKPDYWGGYNDLGYLYYSSGRFEEAAVQYRRVSELTPDNYLAFSNLGVMYYYLERWDEARVAFAASIEIQPSDRAYLNLASIYYIEGDYAEAVELSEKAIGINDANYKSWATLANAYYWLPGSRERSLGAYRNAIALAEKRLELNPNDARVRVTLASYYVMVDEKEKAKSYTEEALRNSSDKPFVVYFAGYVYEQLGERDTAMELIGKAVALGYPIEEIKRDPWLTDFRADERFRQLLEQLE